MYAVSLPFLIQKLEKKYTTVYKTDLDIFIYAGSASAYFKTYNCWSVGRYPCEIEA